MARGVERFWSLEPAPSKGNTSVAGRSRASPNRHARAAESPVLREPQSSRSRPSPSRSSPRRSRRSSHPITSSTYPRHPRARPAPARCPPPPKLGEPARSEICTSERCTSRDDGTSRDRSLASGTSGAVAISAGGPPQPVRRTRQQQPHPARRRTGVEGVPHRDRGLPHHPPITPRRPPKPPIWARSTPGRRAEQGQNRPDRPPVSPAPGMVSPVGRASKHRHRGASVEGRFRKHRDVPQADRSAEQKRLPSCPAQSFVIAPDTWRGSSARTRDRRRAEMRRAAAHCWSSTTFLDVATQQRPRGRSGRARPHRA